MARNEYKGFNLFFDISDEELRSRNQAVVLRNIAQAHRQKDNNISAQGAGLIVGYFSEIAPQFRAKVMEKFEQAMKEDGFVRD